MKTESMSAINRYVAVRNINVKDEAVVGDHRTVKTNSESRSCFMLSSDNKVNNSLDFSVSIL